MDLIIRGSILSQNDLDFVHGGQDAAQDDASQACRGYKCTHENGSASSCRGFKFGDIC